MIREPTVKRNFWNKASNELKLAVPIDFDRNNTLVEKKRRVVRRKVWRKVRRDGILFAYTIVYSKNLRK